MTLSPLPNMLANQELLKPFTSLETVSQQWKERVESRLKGMVWTPDSTGTSV